MPVDPHGDGYLAAILVGSHSQAPAISAVDHLNLAQIDMRMDSLASGLTTLDEDIPFPTVNAAFIIKAAPGFRIRTEADVMSVTVSGNKVDILDARLQAEYYFAHFVGLFAGYRTYSFDVEADDFGLVDAEFDGIYAGLGVKF